MPYKVTFRENYDLCCGTLLGVLFLYLKIEFCIYLESDINTPQRAAISTRLLTAVFLCPIIDIFDRKFYEDTLPY
ncbi:MAG: hypothetical protein K0R92_3505 [Lachnospiraceae bacterium]|jgi:hypothetical protein|nr:hypothetical protein [Lachnospiraceae bacterium]